MTIIYVVIINDVIITVGLLVNKGLLIELSMV